MMSMRKFQDEVAFRWGDRRLLKACKIRADLLQRLDEDLSADPEDIRGLCHEAIRAWLRQPRVRSMPDMEQESFVSMIQFIMDDIVPEHMCGGK